MGGCQNYGPFLGTLNNRCRIIIGTQTGTIILTTTHIKNQRTRRNTQDFLISLPPQGFEDFGAGGQSFHEGMAFVRLSLRAEL